MKNKHCWLYNIFIMRRLTISLIVICLSISCFAQMRAAVDERIELTGTVFRLAGISEYSRGYIPEYDYDIDSCFQDFKEGPLTEYIKTMRRENGLGYSAVAASAMFLKIEDGKVRINDEMDLSKLPGLGMQWKDEKSFRKYVRLLNDFYIESDYHAFFESHRPLFGRVTDAMSNLLKCLAPEWFSDFFGHEFLSMNLYVSPVNGSSNYYLATDSYSLKNTGEGFSIIIGGQEYYPVEMMYPLIHEICHHYSNPMFDRHWQEMKDAAETMYPYVSGTIMQYGYGNAYETMMEWQNNLFTLMYYKDNFKLMDSYVFPEEVKEKLRQMGLKADLSADDFVVPECSEMTERGFIWMQRSVDFMKNFYSNRDIYHDVEDFMPQLVGFLDNAAKNYGQIIFEYKHRRPYVTDIFPVNGSNLLEVPVDEIRITFSEPMTFGISSVGPPDDTLGVSWLPLVEFHPMTNETDPQNGRYWADERTFVVRIDRQGLEMDKEYGVVLSGRAFCDSEYNKMESDYVITYTTDCNSTGTTGM